MIVILSGVKNLYAMRIDASFVGMTSFSIEIDFL